MKLRAKIVNHENCHNYYVYKKVDVNCKIGRKVASVLDNSKRDPIAKLISELY